MGGTALLEKSGIESQRLTLDEFHRVTSEVTKILDELGIKWMDVPFIREKTDFGDIDLIVIDERSFEERKYNNISPLIKIQENLDKFGINEDLFINNNPYGSILYESKYQVDFIVAQPEWAEYNRNYLSYNDLGNLLGRTVKRFNITHGHDGLYYDYYSEDKSHRHRFLLTYDYNAILRILGLDKEQFYKGFDTYKEMFDFVQSSKYFDPEIFKFENLNNRNRVRDKKRKVYNMFLQYIDFDKKCEAVYDPTVDYPWVVPAVQDYIAEYHRRKAIREAVPGRLVMEHTGLKGKQLGYLIEQVKKAYEDNLIGISQEKLIMYIDLQYAAHKEEIEKRP